MNFRQTSLYRTYNHSVVPTYLQGRPRSTILHCLHRKASSNKFCCNDIHDVDRQVGVFEVKGKNQTYKVDLVPPQACHHALVGIGKPIIHRASTPGTNFQMLTWTQSIFCGMRVPSQATSHQMAEAQERRESAAVYGAIQLARKFVKKKKKKIKLTVFFGSSQCVQALQPQHPQRSVKKVNQWEVALMNFLKGRYITSLYPSSVPDSLPLWLGSLVQKLTFNLLVLL